METTKEHLIILGAVGLGLSVLEVFGIILGSCLYIKLRHDFDDWVLLYHNEYNNTINSININNNNNGQMLCRYVQYDITWQTDINHNQIDQ